MAPAFFPAGYTSAYSVALAVLTGAIVASAIFVRRRGEWTRRGFTWHYVPMVLFVSFLCLSIILNQVSTQESGHSTFYGLSAKQINLVLVTRILRQHTDVFYLTVLVMLLSGFKTSLSFGGTNVTFRLIHFSTLLLLILFSWTCLVLGELITADITDGVYPENSTKVYSTITAGWDILEFFVSLEILGCGFFVLYNAVRARKFGFPHLKAVYLLVALFINLLRTTCLLIVATGNISKRKVTSLAVQHLELVFYSWLSVIMTIVITIMGVDKTWLVSDWNPSTSFRLQQRNTLGQSSSPEDSYQMEQSTTSSETKMISTATVTASAVA